MAKNDNKASKHKRTRSNGPAGAVYGMRFVGAVIYFISHASGFWIGVLKAIVWPAMLVYYLMDFLKL